MTAAATYMYAICRPISPDALADVRGIGNEPLRVIGDGELCCVVSSVDLAEFDEAALRQHLEDLAWLEDVSRRHDGVVQAVTGTTTTIPLRLATICRDDRSAIDRLERLRGPALRLLETLDGREEWGIKVYDVSEPSLDAASPSQPSSGTDYLRQRRAQVTARTQAAAAAAEYAETMCKELAELAVQVHRHRPQDPRLSGVQFPMALNAAFLVDSSRRAEFRAAVARLSAHRPPGAVALTGPWPPYSFASLDAS